MSALTPEADPGSLRPVSHIPESRYFAQYVVRQFKGAKALALSLDPFEVAIHYIDAPMPRQLPSLLDAASLQVMC